MREKYEIKILITFDVFHLCPPSLKSSKNGQIGYEYNFS
jgi:hypothetical protein